MVTPGREAQILHTVLKLGRPNVNELVHNGQSPTKLKANLEELVSKHWLRMDREKNRHRFRITSRGLRELFKYDMDAASSAVRAFASLVQTRDDWSRHVAGIIRGKTRLDANDEEELWGHPYLAQRQKVRELVRISHELLFRMEGRGDRSDAYISIRDNGAVSILPFEEARDRFRMSRKTQT